MAFGIRDIGNSLIALNSGVRTITAQLARIATALEDRNKLEYDRRFSPQDLGIRFKTDEASPARTRGDELQRDYSG
jgi:hypothetical protein